MRSIILALDAGSSSVRCTAYEYFDLYGDCGLEEADVVGAPPSDSLTSSEPLVQQIEGAAHTIPLAAIVPATGHIKIHEVLKAVDECIDEVLRLLRETINESYQIVAVGFSTFVMNLVGVDTACEPVGEAATLSYACNREDVVKECQKMKDALGPEKAQAVYQHTGTPIHPSYAAPQLLAFYGNEANKHMFAKIDKWQTITSICINRWSGKPHLQMPLSFSEASWTGMLDFRTCTWNDDVTELLEQCEDAIRACEDFEPWEFDDYIDFFPPVLDFDANLPFLVGGIPPRRDGGEPNPYWERWPEFRSKSLSLFMGVGDGATANIGSKCCAWLPSSSAGCRRIAVTIGTSAAARVCLPLSIEDESFPSRRYSGDVSVPPGLFCYRVDRDRVLLGGALTDGGSVVEWARSLLNLQSSESFEACLEQVRVVYEKSCTASDQSGGVTMVPFLSGERSTGFRGGAQGCVSGITRETTTTDFMHGCLQSVILRLGCVLKLLNEACRSQQAEGGKQRNSIIVASGNALERNPLWRQMLADCASMDVIVDGDAKEGSSRGIAMMMAGTLRQRELGKPVEAYMVEESLKIADETKANSALAVKEHWSARESDQESLIGAVAPTWDV